MLPYSFWTDVEKPMKHVLYGDTDSIFINVPLKAKDDDYKTQELIDIANQVSNDINERVTYTTESFLLPKLGVDISNNQTFFKTELVADSIMFLDIKKNYAYHELSNNGKIREDGGTFEYKGIPVVKSNVAPLSKKFIRRLVETVVLNKNITNIEMAKHMEQVAKDTWAELAAAIESGDFLTFATPCKWSGADYEREPAQIIAMRMYNTITETETFTPLSGGLYFPIQTNSLLLSKLSKLSSKHSDSNVMLKPEHQKTIKYGAIPYDYDSDEIKELLKKFDIKIDPQQIFNLVNGQVAVRICDVIKKYALRDD